LKFFLDENFPLKFHKELTNRGYESRHVITDDLRGISNGELTELLTSDEYVFITHDDDFEQHLVDENVTMFLSRVPQELPIEERVTRWLRAVETYVDSYADGQYSFFEIEPDGSLVPWEQETNENTSSE
jgi:predicted nuclease of predicted toxin-antitoxin system